MDDPPSPPFAFDNIPSEAETLILVMDDPDTPNGLFVHWVVYNIPADVTGFELGVVPDGAVQVHCTYTYVRLCERV